MHQSSYTLAILNQTKVNIKPFHFLHPDFSKIDDIEAFFDQMKWNYPQLNKDGFYNSKTKKSMFVYRIKSKSNVYHGIIAALDIQDYLNGKIKKHENTLTDQEDNMVNLFIERQGIIKPVLMAYDEQKKIKELIAQCFLGVKPKFKINFKKDKQIHEFYEVNDKTFIKLIQKEFKSKVKKAYIADGHHRMAAISKFLLHHPELGKKSISHVMCAFFDFNELKIHPYNRIIHALDLVSKEELLLFLEKYAQLSPLAKMRKSSSKFELILRIGTKNYAVQWNADVIQYYKQKNGIALDIDIFNDLILHELLKIEDIRSSNRIFYHEGIKSLKAIQIAVDENPEYIGVLFFPVIQKDFLKVADEHMVLPPKSTWFEPRIRNGIIVQDIPFNEMTDL